MITDDMHQRVVDDYKITGSVKKTAENIGTTLECVRRRWFKLKRHISVQE